MQQYESYYDSGVEWIGEIPEGWDVKKFRFIFDLTKGLTITKANLKDSGIPCINYGEIHSKYGFDVIPERDALKCVEKDYLESSEQSLMQRGDFVFADTSEDIEGSGNFSHLHSDTPIFAGYHTIIARLKLDAFYRFVAYYIDSIAFRSQVRQEVKGVKVYSITNAILKNTFMVLPPIEEQESMANFLDKKTKEIDKLIDQKEQLLSLYEEEKKAIINQAVTKGIDPNAKMKESGVPWLGEIPEGWEVKKLKYIGKSIIGLTYSPDEVVLDNAKLVLRSSNIQNGKLSLKDCVYVDKEIPKKLVVKKGDILICSRNGSRALIGKNITIDEELAGNTFGAFMTVFRSDYYKFVSKYFNSQVFNGQSGLFLTSTVNQLTIHTLNNFFIALPPKEERQNIVGFIEDKVKSIDVKIQKTKNIILLQKEYRLALISEVVTGKIKVPEEM